MTKIHIVDGTNGVKPTGFYVYTHRRLTDNLVMHVGKGNGRRAWSKSGRNRYWRHMAAKHGVIVEIYRDGMLEACSLSLEKILIFIYKSQSQPLTNLTYGGGGISGWKHSEETKRIISMHSKAQVRTEKQMASLRVNDGKPIRPEAKEKMSKAKIGKKSPVFDWRVHVFMHVDHGEFIGLQSDFRSTYGVSSSQLSHLIKGRFSSTKGWTYHGTRGISEVIKTEETK